MPTPADVMAWTQVLEKGGLLLVFFALAVGQAYAYHKRWVVPGWFLTERDAIIAERDVRIAKAEREAAWWRDMALSSMHLARTFGDAAMQPPPGGHTPQGGV